MESKKSVSMENVSQVVPKMITANRGKHVIPIHAFSLVERVKSVQSATTAILITKYVFHTAYLIKIVMVDTSVPMVIV